MKEELKALEALRKKLLNKKVKTERQFEAIQDELNKVEIEIKNLKKS